MKGIVYLLRNPINLEVFYIGQTMCSLDNRLRQHLSENRKTEKSRIVNDILNAGKLPLIEELESIECNGASSVLKERELFWIRHYMPVGNIMGTGVFKKKCVICGKNFEGASNNSIYCSNICRAKRPKKENRVKVTPPTIKKCLYCSIEFNCYKSTKTFCSDKCRVYFNRRKKEAINNNANITVIHKALKVDFNTPFVELHKKCVIVVKDENGKFLLDGERVNLVWADGKENIDIQLHDVGKQTNNGLLKEENKLAVEEPTQNQVPTHDNPAAHKYNFTGEKFFIIEKYTQYPLAQKPTHPVEAKIWLAKKKVADQEIKDAWDKR